MINTKSAMQFYKIFYWNLNLASASCKTAICFLSAFLILGETMQAQKFNYHEKCKTTYNEIFKLKIPYARQIITEQKAAEPQNLAWLLLESYCDFLTSFIREDYEEFEQMEIEFDARLKAIDALPNDDPWKRYAKAEIYMHKAFARAKYEEYISTIWDLRKGFKLLEENVRRFPEFQPNNKSLGFFHAVIGTIPGKYRFGAKLLGFSGNVEQGMQEIKDYMVFAKAENTFFDEAQLLNIFFLIYLDKQHEKAWKIVQEELQPRENLFHNFMYTEIAYKAGEGDIAINTIENRPKGPEYVEYYFMDFFEGIVKMTRLDEDAGESIQKFIDNFSGRHYLKEAWQRLALCNLLKGDTALYLQQLANCKTEGAALMDADKQAQKDAELNVIPNIGLLKARFLNDGGYTERAVAVLQAMDTSKLSQNHKIEWLYRNGRVLENGNSIDKAVSFYKASIKTSPNNELYFAAKACLHLGHFYIKNKQLALAEKYYKMVASFDKHPFKDSFEQQAKAGLSRVKGFN